MSGDGFARVEADLRKRMAASAFHNWMGMALGRIGPGEVEVTLDAAAHHLNLQGSVHGGVLASLADAAAGLAVRTRVPHGSRHVTVQLGMSYLRASQTGRLIAHGRAVRVGRRIAFAEARIEDGGGRLLATAQATVAVRPPREAAG
jgi:uncharacterized protein (TIGR00369 family)